MKEQQARYLGRNISGTLVQEIVCARGQKQIAVFQDGTIFACREAGIGGRWESINWGRWELGKMGIGGRWELERWELGEVGVGEDGKWRNVGIGKVVIGGGGSWGRWERGGK